MARRARTAEEWQALVADWDQSGQSGDAFAAERGLHASTLRWWKSRFRAVPKRQNLFVPVEVSPVVSARVGRVEARLPSGVVLVFEACDAASLRELVSVLGSAGS